MGNQLSNESNTTLHSIMKFSLLSVLVAAVFLFGVAAAAAVVDVEVTTRDETSDGPGRPPRRTLVSKKNPAQQNNVAAKKLIRCAKKPESRGCSFTKPPDAFDVHVKFGKDDVIFRITTAWSPPYATQFFINYGNNSRLDPHGFAPFGEVVSGMETIERLGFLLGNTYGEMQDLCPVRRKKPAPDVNPYCVYNKSGNKCQGISSDELEKETAGQYIASHFPLMHATRVRAAKVLP